MSKITGIIEPLNDKVFVSDMNFEAEVTSGGIFLPSDNAKSTGIHPRWGKVWAVGPTQQDIKVGEWICVQHGRWTRTIEVEADDGSTLELRVVDNDAVMLATDDKPNSIMRSEPVGAGSNVNFNIPGA